MLILTLTLMLIKVKACKTGDQGIMGHSLLHPQGYPCLGTLFAWMG